MTDDDIKTAWRDVFPNSCCSISHPLGGIYAKFFLAKDNSEFPNGISHNDPLNYMAEYSNGTYREVNLGLSIAPPAGSYLVYGTAKLRKVTIKNATPEKLTARFKVIRAFVMEHADQMIKLSFDISTK